MKKTKIFGLGILLIVFLSVALANVYRQQELDDSSGLSHVPGKIVIQLSKEISPIVPRKKDDIIQTGVWPIDILFQQFRVNTMKRLFPAPKYRAPDLT